MTNCTADPHWFYDDEIPVQTEPPPPSGLHGEAALLLSDAADLVTGDRARSYGDPEESFGEIAYLWRWWLLGRDPATISAVDVASMLGLMKTRRKKAEPGNRDHWVDEAGYAGLGGAIAMKDHDAQRTAPSEAWSRGYSAFGSGDYNNPYDSGTESAAEWMRGWRKAEEIAK